MHCRSRPSCTAPVCTMLTMLSLAAAAVCVPSSQSPATTRSKLPKFSFADSLQSPQSPANAGSKSSDLNLSAPSPNHSSSVSPPSPVHQVSPPPPPVQGQPISPSIPNCPISVSPPPPIQSCLSSVSSPLPTSPVQEVLPPSQPSPLSPPLPPVHGSLTAARSNCPSPILPSLPSSPPGLPHAPAMKRTPLSLRFKSLVSALPSPSLLPIQNRSNSVFPLPAQNPAVPNTNASFGMLCAS